METTSWQKYKVKHLQSHKLSSQGFKAIHAVGHGCFATEFHGVSNLVPVSTKFPV